LRRCGSTPSPLPRHDIFPNEPNALNPNPILSPPPAPSASPEP
jgi:hypothetical protein